MIKPNPNLILKVLQWGLLAVIFFLPFAITPWTIYPFVFGKTLFFQSAIEILAAFYLVLVIIAPRYRPRLDVLTILILAYFSALIVSALSGIDFQRSFWGTEERGTGLLAQFHFLTFFIMARSVLGEEKYRRRVYFIAVVSGIFLSIIALLQLKGLKIFGVDLGMRLSSTTANPIFFASILLFYVTFALYLAAKAKGLLRFFYLACSLFFVGIIFATETRGAVLAMIFGIVFFLIITAVKSISKKTRLAIGVSFAFLALLLAAFWFNRDSQFIKKTRVLNRFVNLYDITAKTRFLGWGIALEAFKERPVLGWGPENFYAAFNKNYNPRLLEYSYYETWWDRPHNIILEVMVNAGVVGAVLYLSIFVYAAAILFKRKNNAENILATGLLVYLAQNMLVFDTPSSLLLFMALLSGVGRKPESGSSDVEIAKYGVLPDSRRIFAIIVLPISLFAAGIMVYKFNWQPMTASNAMLHATIYASDRSDIGSIELFRAALNLPTPYKDETRVQVAQIITAILSKQTIPQERFREFFDFGEREIKTAIALHPQHAYFQYMLGRLYTEALNYDGSYAGEAETALTKAIELSPKKQQIHFGLAKFFVDQGRMKDALEVYRKMVEYAPNVGEAHWFYAVLLEQQGEKDAAEQELAEVGRLGFMPRHYEEKLLLARVMAKQKNYQKVIDYMENALIQKPDQADIYAQLAVAYKELGKFDEAKRNALRAAELDPSFAAEAEIFLKTLEK